MAVRTIREGYGPVVEDEEDDGDVRKKEAKGKTSPRHLPREHEENQTQRESLATFTPKRP